METEKVKKTLLIELESEGVETLFNNYLKKAGREKDEYYYVIGTLVDANPLKKEMIQDLIREYFFAGILAAKTKGKVKTCKMVEQKEEEEEPKKNPNYFG
jgi:hypothetical protein